MCRTLARGAMLAWLHPVHPVRAVTNSCLCLTDLKAKVCLQVESKTKLAAGVKPLVGGGGIFKSAAVEVLRRERRLMTTGDITKYVHWTWVSLSLHSIQFTRQSKCCIDAGTSLGRHLFLRCFCLGAHEKNKSNILVLHAKVIYWSFCVQAGSGDGADQLSRQDARCHHGLSAIHRCQKEIAFVCFHSSTGANPESLHVSTISSLCLAALSVELDVTHQTSQPACICHVPETYRLQAQHVHSVLHIQELVSHQSTHVS